MKLRGCQDFEYPGQVLFSVYIMVWIPPRTERSWGIIMRPKLSDSAVYSLLTVPPSPLYLSPCPLPSLSMPKNLWILAPLPSRSPPSLPNLISLPSCVFPQHLAFACHGTHLSLLEMALFFVFMGPWVQNGHRGWMKDGWMDGWCYMLSFGPIKYDLSHYSDFLKKHRAVFYINVYLSPMNSLPLGLLWSPLWFILVTET